MNTETEVAKGTLIHLVLANGEHQMAVVTKLHRDDRVDLETELASGEPLVITGSPRDDSGKRADSWHLPETPAPPAPPADAVKSKPAKTS